MAQARTYRVVAEPDSWVELTAEDFRAMATDAAVAQKVHRAVLARMAALDITYRRAMIELEELVRKKTME